MEQKVIEFISTRLGFFVDEIKLESKIESDFGMGGLDTISFYEEFFHEFEIQNPEDFDLDKYVTPDGCLSIGLMIKSIFSKSARRKLILKEVSVRHLVKVAETKYWIEEN